MSDLVDPAGRRLDGALNDDQITALMAREIRELEAGAGAAILMLPGDLLFSIVGLVQLALRHPDVSAFNREQAAAFVDSAREYFADAPTVLEIIRRGDDPNEDV